MTRKKVKLAFIVNDSARKATYKKRKKGLLKKVDELSTLCGIDACAIVFSPYDPQPEVWPSTWGAQRVLCKFSTMPELEQSKKMMNQETFLKQRILKMKEQVKKQKKDNRDKEMNLLMYQSLAAGKIVRDNMAMTDLNDLAWMIDQNLKDVTRRLETMNMNAPQVITPPSHVQLEVVKNEEIAYLNHSHEMGMTSGDNNMQRSSFMDLMMNGIGNETMPQFGDPNAQMGFWPNLLP